MAKLPMSQRLAVLALFQATVAVAYLSIIEVEIANFDSADFEDRALESLLLERSKAREGSFHRDGYDFFEMYGEPKPKREQAGDPDGSNHERG